MRRHYIWSRKAWTPNPVGSIVIGMICGEAVYLALSLFVLHGTMAIWLAFGLGVIASVLVIDVRWALWKRRHPVLPKDVLVRELMDDMRRAAPWN